MFSNPVSTIDGTRSCLTLTVPARFQKKVARRSNRFTNRALQQIQELLNSGAFLLWHLALPAGKTGIKLGHEQRILKTFHGPVKNRNNHLHIHIFSQPAAFQAKAHEAHAAIRVLRDQEAVNLALQPKISPVVTEQRDAKGDPVVMQQVFCTCPPGAKHLEGTAILHFRVGVQILGKGAYRPLVNLKKQAVLAAEVLENRTLGNAQCSGDVAHASRVVTLLGKVLHCDFDDARALGLRTGTLRQMALITRGTNRIAGNTTHDSDLKSRKNT